jgi:hypothetical protein
MSSIKEILQEVIAEYEGKALNGYSYLTHNQAEDVFSVVSVGEFKGQRIVDMGLVVRLVDNTIIIERDANDKPLVDALLQAGVPRENIILAYGNESLKTG